MREEHNFDNLARDKKIVIPIIQRDYAQGRYDPKAIVVRTRLIDEWIDILKNDDLRMDFNYIYGNEFDGMFYPVDGQQRLTSLYLLHWYLANSTDHTAEIEKWQFDYKTRNSASEFFAFLRNVERSNKLFEILCSDLPEEEKQKKIRNEKWFKTKWENDPSVVSCINFLCLLSEKLRGSKENFNAFWDRLTNKEKPAVYFTYLKNENEYTEIEAAEIDAAKKYTRMNARGKRLTNFENLKAMIDEIEMKHIHELDYCVHNEKDDITNTISWTYDRIYIDRFYQCFKAESLIETTKAINNESESWFRLIYYVYALKYGKEIPAGLIDEGEKYGDSFEDIIYKISQGRIQDETIKQYLHMLKAVFELLCNGKPELPYKYSELSKKRNESIAFVIFASTIWTPGEDNIKLLSNWYAFKEMLDDLSFDKWLCCSDGKVAEILSKMAEGIKSTESKSVIDYFLCNDFEHNNPFGDVSVLSDMKCRILERKIKSKLIKDEVVNKDSLNKVYETNRRWGCLYYLCGYLDDWSINDWSKKPAWSNKAICDFIELIETKGSVSSMLDQLDAKLIYAYASQYDRVNNCLRDESHINSCNNEHIWSDDYLTWTDEEFGRLGDKRKKQLGHLKTMLELLCEHKRKNKRANNAAVKDYAVAIQDYFEETSGYETCWLRFAVKYKDAGSDLLSSELELADGTVTLKKVPVILKVYLKQMGYNYNEKINSLKYFDKRYTFFVGDEKRIPYYATNTTCTFMPDIDNDGKYRHTQRGDEYGWDLSGNVVSRNMDLLYRAFLDLSEVGCVVKNSFLSIDVLLGVYKISVYELGETKDGKLTVNIKEATIDDQILEQAEKNVQKWNKLFALMREYPRINKNYDPWIELWNDEYTIAFGDNFDSGNVVYNRDRGQRPRKKWDEIFGIRDLDWKARQELI